MLAGLRSTSTVLAMGMALLVLPSGAFAKEAAEDTAHKSTDERLDTLEGQVKTLAGELSKAVTEAAVPKDGNWENYYGVGPAAGKVYRKDSGLSIGGYGEVVYEYDTMKERGSFDTLRAVLYVGYKFSDKWVLNSEFEFEHGGGPDPSDEDTSNVYVEFLNLDYQYSQALNFRAGLILNPMGFVNQVHEPTFYYGTDRPEVEQRMIPTTWREGGAGVYGRVLGRISYQAYGVVSLDGAKFDGSGYRSGRQKGIKSKASNFSFVARADVDILPGLMAGGSVYTGHQGQKQDKGQIQMTMYELHAEYKKFGFTGRALFAQSFIDNPNTLNDLTSTDALLAKESQGWYIVGAYDIFSLLLPDSRQSLEPFIRYSQVNTQKEFQTAPNAAQLTAGQDFNNEVITVGLQYKPIPQVVFKLDYRYEKAKETGDAISKEVQVGVGYVF